MLPILLYIIISLKRGISTVILKLVQFFSDTPFHERFLNFHKQLTEHYDTGGAKLYMPDTMELFRDKHAPGLFNELQQVIGND